MKKYSKLTFTFSFFLYLISISGFTQDYPDLAEQEKQLKALAEKFADITDLKLLNKTNGDKSVWVLSVGKGDKDNHPAIAVVGGVDGSMPVSSALSLQFAEKLLINSAEDSINNLLDSVTFYIIPNVSPDAMAQYFADVKYERQVNARATDDDRDGRINEDPYEDLNGDGLISMMRVKDETGSWMISEKDERVMVKTERNKGENGYYKLFSEGVDNDQDGRFNEDGEGGVNFNKNLTFQFPYFTPGAGEFPVSEKETRSVLDFLYEKRNIYAVFTFGPADNLSAPLVHKDQSGQKMINYILKDDAEINQMVSEKYRVLTKQKNEMATTFPGGFMQWAYFHFGRFSFSTPAYYIPRIKDKNDSVANGKENPDLNFLKWADSIGIDNNFIEWNPVEHPDFPGQKVEVGGIVNFIKKNPPVNMLDSISDIHNEFLLYLASIRPRIDLVNLKSENLGDDLYRISVDIYNHGRLPVMSELGKKVKWVQKPKMTIELEDDQLLVSGRRINLLDELNSDDSQSYKWLVKGKGDIKLIGGAPQAGFKTITVNLK